MYCTRYSSKISIKLDFSGQIFGKSLNIKLYENPSRRNRVVPCGRTDVTKLIFAFHNVTNAPKNLSILGVYMVWNSKYIPTFQRIVVLSRLQPTVYE